MAGKLSPRQLQNYAIQYVPFVEAFPRFVSSTHSLCTSAENRKLLLENLLDEEGFGQSKPHPKLWRQFADGVKADPQTLPTQTAADLEEKFFALCRSSYEEGLCALYAYEYQIPEIAEAKIKGLAMNYNIRDERAVEFFSVHQKSDVFHSEACQELISQISPEKFSDSIAAAKTASQSLWNFLSEVHAQ
jgi:pyrroloquinoline-quinone synthase